MPFDENLNPNGTTGKRLTILSIDGGGVRGIIPATILEVLEAELRRVEARLGNTGQHHLYEYFDMIAGTSSGGLITALITTPTLRGSTVPSCNATEVVQFFERDAVRIFPKKFPDKTRLRWVLEGLASVFGPIYSVKPLKDLLRKTFGVMRLSDALTSVIIPAFDTKNEVPVFFSNLQGVDSAKPLYNVYVRDACQGTTAVPVFFPAARFREQVLAGQNQPPRPRKFNVIDGGIAVNDPTLVAVTQKIAEKRQALLQTLQAIAVVRRRLLEEDLRANEVDRQEILEEELRAIAEDRRAILEEDLRANAVDRQAILEEELRANAVDRRAILEEDLRAIAEVRRARLEEELQAIAEERSRDCRDFSNVLVLSLGTGQHPMRFIAKPHWSSVQWLLNPWGSPLLNSFLSASEDMVEYYTSMIFDALQSGHHYLRIQTDSLSTSEFWGIDDATRQNLLNLELEAGQLLDGDVSKRDFATGKLVAINGGGKNREALHRFARWLVEERRERQRQQPRVEIRAPELPGNRGQQTVIDWCCWMLRTAVVWCCLKLGAALGGFCLMMRTAVAGFFLMMGTALGGLCLMMRAPITGLCVLWLPLFYLFDFMYGVDTEIVKAASCIGG